MEPNFSEQKKADYPKNFNRFLYRAETSPVTENPEYMSSTVDSAQRSRIKQGNSPGERGNAKEVITGTVITACLIKSSDQDDRIEIGQNLDAVVSENNIGNLVFSPLVRSLDYLVAYRPGNQLGFILTGIGAVYIGYALPTFKLIVWDEDSLTYLTNQSEATWSVSKLGSGNYRVTHNLNRSQYAVNVTCSSQADLLVYALAYITNKGLNSFDIRTTDLVGNAESTDWECQVSIFA